MTFIDDYLEDADKVTTNKTLALYKLYADTSCDSTVLNPDTKQQVYALITNKLITELWHALLHNPALGSGFARRHAFLSQIRTDGYYCFSPEETCRIMQLNRAINLRKINTPVLNLLKSLL